MKVGLILMIAFIFSTCFLFSQDVNVILTNGTIIKGNMIGKTADSIVIEGKDNKAQAINITEIQAVFDAANGNQIDLSPAPVIQERSAVYRPREPLLNGPKNAFALDLIDLALGSVRVSYEHSLSDWFSLKAEGAYSPNYFWYNGISFWSAALFGRFYFGYSSWYRNRTGGLTGPFIEVGAGAEAATINYSYSDPYGSYQINGNFPIAPMIRFGFGNKIVFGNGSGIFIEPHFGYEISLGYWNYNYTGTGIYSDYSYDFPYFQGFGESFYYGLDFGYAF